MNRMADTITSTELVNAASFAPSERRRRLVLGSAITRSSPSDSRVCPQAENKPFPAPSYVALVVRSLAFARACGPTPGLAPSLDRGTALVGADPSSGLNHDLVV